MNSVIDDYPAIGLAYVAEGVLIVLIYVARIGTPSINGESLYVSNPANDHRWSVRCCSSGVFLTASVLSTLIVSL